MKRGLPSNLEQSKTRVIRLHVRAWKCIQILSYLILSYPPGTSSTVRGYACRHSLQIRNT
jgi:hypothetical protein